MGKRAKPEEIIAKLREVEVRLARGETAATARCAAAYVSRPIESVILQAWLWWSYAGRRQVQMKEPTRRKPGREQRSDFLAPIANSHEASKGLKPTKLG